MLNSFRMKVKELMGIAPSQVIHFQIHKDCQGKKPTEQLNKLNTYYVWVKVFLFSPSLSLIE